MNVPGQGTVLKALKRGLACLGLNGRSGVKWPRERVPQAEAEGWAGSRMQPTSPLPWSPFRNSTNLKPFLSDHLIKQDFPDLLRVLNLPEERLWLQELHQLGPDSKDPSPGCSMADSVNGVSSVWSWWLWRDYYRGAHVCARVCYSISPTDYFLETSKND